MIMKLLQFASCLCVTLVITITGSRWCSSYSWLLLLWCSGCTWREGRFGNALDSRRVDVVDDAKGMLPVRVLRDGHVFCVSRLPLPLPLSDRVPVVLVALGRKDVLVTILMADVLILLMLMMDC